MFELYQESIALQRIELVTRLVVNGECDLDDKELALGWLAELSAALVSKLDEHDKKHPQKGGDKSGGVLQ